MCVSQCFCKNYQKPLEMKPGRLNKFVIGVLLLLVGSLSLFESGKDREIKFSLRTVAVKSLFSMGVMTP